MQRKQRIEHVFVKQQPSSLAATDPEMRELNWNKVLIPRSELARVPT
jgi:hypothetical protein